MVITKPVTNFVFGAFLMPFISNILLSELSSGIGTWDNPAGLADSCSDRAHLLCTVDIQLFAPHMNQMVDNICIRWLPKSKKKSDEKF